MNKSIEHIVITGGSSGIGQALAFHYAAPGRIVSLCGRDEARLADTAAQCGKQGAIVHTACLDVSDQAAMRAWLETCWNAAPVDLIIANAGISGGADKEQGIESESQVRALFDVNVYGVFNTLYPLLPHMIARGSGQIALMSSLAGYRGWPGAPAYCGSKAAVKVYGEALRGAVAGRGIQVSVICPGYVISRMTAGNAFPMPFLMPTEKAAAIIARGLARNQGRIAFPKISMTIAWLFMLLPDALMQIILRKMPAKAPLAQEIDKT
jgi:short-subunit dehydrogenase